MKKVDLPPCAKSVWGVKLWIFSKEKYLDRVKKNIDTDHLKYDQKK